MESARVFRETMVPYSLWPTNLNAVPGPTPELSITMAFSEELQLKLTTIVDNQIPDLVSELEEPHAVLMKVAHQLEIAMLPNGQRDQLSTQYLPSLLTRDIGLVNIPEPGGLLLRMDIPVLPEFQQ